MREKIRTFSGIHMSPADPRPEEICIEDIAHALSLMTRANGHFPVFYSVAQHSLDCAAMAQAEGRSSREVLACLLHDASESVALSTLHSAKGLEYENVYLIDVNEGVMPYKKAVLDQDIEEERRMFYVGMTRAKKYLHLFSVKQMNQKDADISRFIAEAGERLSPPCR